MAGKTAVDRTNEFRVFQNFIILHLAKSRVITARLFFLCAAIYESLFPIYHKSIMQKVVTAEEMREIDRLTTEKYGIPSILLMENAAHAAARVITEKLGGSVKDKSFLILCGKGNNGGDGAALARILWTMGANVDVYLLGKVEDTKGDAQANLKILKKTNFEETSKYGNALFIKESYLAFEEVENPDWWRKRLNRLYQTDVVVDAVFGTGLTRPIGEEWYKVIKSYWLGEREDRNTNFLTVSLDLPSGLDTNKSQQGGENAQVDLTITFTAPKPANVLPPASNFSGELVTVNIGSPQELIDNSPSQLYLAEKEDAQDWLLETKFTADSYKKTRGHALLIAGSKNMSGAAVLCADAAMVSGGGLVTIATAESALSAISARVLPEIMTLGFTETLNGTISKEAVAEVLKFAEKMDVIGIGCGLSSSDETTREFVRAIVEKRQKPMVLDADALNALSPFMIQGNAEFPLILTPHEGEFLRLLGTADREILRDRVAAVREFAAKHNVILVLKGERTLIGEPAGKVVINPTGNAGLGKAGNGDTLTGIITGFLTQTFASFDESVASENRLNSTFRAVVAAVYIAGLAGDIAAEKFGKRSMTASDVRESLIESFCQLGEN